MPTTPVGPRDAVAGFNALRGVPYAAVCLALACCGLTIAADPAEPAPFTPDIAARPINGSAAMPSDAPLRWKAKPSVNAGEYVASEASAQPIQFRASTQQQPLRAGWNITRIDPSVRPAQYTTSDPFGDKKQENGPSIAPPANAVRPAQANREPQLVLQPTQAEANIEELPPPRTLSPVRRAAPANPVLTAAQPGTLVPGTSMRSQVPPGPPATDPFGEPSYSRSTAPCDRVYNDRNCCDLENNCHEFRNRLLSDSIKNISLDITPRYNPDLPEVEDEADRAAKLGNLETRQWRNRRGAVVATGRMINLQNGAVVLVDESGRESRLPVGELGEDELCFVTAWWRLPAECPLGGIRTSERSWLAGTFTYHASALCHKPLYFEEVQLERYGHTAGPFRQPVLSGAHFIKSLVTLPYHMGMSPPTECEYALGYYRPGNCAPWMIPPIPLSLQGAKWQIGAALGFSYLIP